MVTLIFTWLLAIQSMAQQSSQQLSPEQKCLQMKIEKAQEMWKQFQGKKLVKLYKTLDPHIQEIEALINTYGDDQTEQYEVEKEGNLWKVSPDYTLPNYIRHLLSEKLLAIGFTPAENIPTAIRQRSTGQIAQTFAEGLVIDTDGYWRLEVARESSVWRYSSENPVILYSAPKELWSMPGEIYGLRFYSSGQQTPEIRVVFSTIAHEEHTNTLTEYALLSEFLDRQFKILCPETSNWEHQQMTQWIQSLVR